MIKKSEGDSIAKGRTDKSREVSLRMGRSGEELGKDRRREVRVSYDSLE